MIVEARVTINGSRAAIWAHESRPQGIAAKLMSIPMGFLLKGVVKKYLLKDLNDIKAAVEHE